MAGLKIIGDVGVKVRPDTSDFRRDLKNALEGIERTIRPIEVRIIPEIVESDKNRVKREMERLKKDIEDKAIKLKTELNNGDLARVGVLLAGLARNRTVLIKTKIDAGSYGQAATALAALSGGRVVSGWIEDFVDALANLDRSVPVLAATALGVTTLATSAISASAHTFSLASGLVQMGQAGLAIPGILGGITIGVGTTIAALADFNDQLPEVADKLGDLQDALSANFWEQAREPIRDFIDSIWPQFSAGVENAATEIGQFFANFSGSMTEALQHNNALATMFGDLSDSINTFGQHTDAFATIIARLGQVGAQWLEPFANWLGGKADEFAQWLTDTSNSQFNAWIQEGVDNVQAFGEVIANAAGILNGLATAAENAGGIGLQGLADKLQNVEEIVKGNTFQENLTNVLIAAREAMDDITNTAGPAFSGFMDNLSDTFTKVAPIIGDTIGPALEAIFEALDQPAVHAGIIAFFDGVKGAVEELAPAMDPLADAIGDILPVLGNLVDNIGGVLADAIAIGAPALEGVAPIVDALVEALDPLSPLIAGAALAFGAFKVAGFIGGIGAATAAIVTNTIAWGANAIAATVSMMQTMYIMGLYVADAVRKVVIHNLALLSLGLAYVRAAAMAAAQFVVMAAKWVAHTVLVVAQVAIQVAAVVAGWIAMAAAAMANAVVMAVAWLIALGPAALVVLAIAAIIAIIVVLIVYWDEIKAKTIEVWDAIKAKLTEAWDYIKTKAIAIWTAVKTWIVTKWNEIRTFVLSVAEAIRQYVVEKWEALKEGVRQKMDALKQSAIDKWEALKEGIQSKVDAIKAWLVGKWDSIKTNAVNAAEALKEAVKTKWDQLKTGVEQKIEKLLGIVKNLPGDIVSALGNVGDLLLGAGKAIIGSLIAGIESGIKKLKGVLSGITSMIPDVKGPPERDKVLLTPAGRMIMDGLIGGIEDRIGNLRSALTDVTDMIANEFEAGSNYRVGVAAHLSANSDDLSALPPVARAVSRAYGSGPSDSTPAPLSIGNITIPLEDLAQLKTLEDFLDMLRVRTRQGVLST